MGFLSEERIRQLGLGAVGRAVRISDKASFYNCPNIQIGDHSRVDDFCVISAGEGGIAIGRYVHVAAHCSLFGRAKIEMADFSGLSSRVSIYSSSDDYSGAAMTNPTVPQELTNVKHAEVRLGRHVIIGAGSVILPGVTLEEGAAVGALSLVRANCESFGIYAGSPARKVGERRRDLLELEKALAALENAK